MSPRQLGRAAALVLFGAAVAVVAMLVVPALYRYFVPANPYARSMTPDEGVNGYHAYREMEWAVLHIGPHEVFEHLRAERLKGNYEKAIPKAQAILRDLPDALAGDKKSLDELRSKIDDLSSAVDGSGVDWADVSVKLRTDLPKDQIPDWIERSVREQPEDWVNHRERTLAKAEALRIDAFGQYLRLRSLDEKAALEKPLAEQEALLLMRVWYLEQRLDRTRMRNGWISGYLVEELRATGILKR